MRRFLLPLTVAALMPITSCRSATPSNSFDSNGKATSTPACAEPENPYEEGSGHYAGYEWAQSNGTAVCGDNSQSFIEGCEEYENQEAEYEECEAQKQQ